MPIYEYECNRCGAVFDCVVLKSSDEHIPECTSCGGTDVRKLVSRVRYMAGPNEGGLAENAEQRLMNTVGKNTDDRTRKEIKDIARTAAKRGKRRFNHMMDTGKSENIEY